MTPRRHPTIHAQLGPPLGKDATRVRPVGRIGGTAGNFDLAVRHRLSQALGPNAQLLRTDAARLVADCDCCYLDDRPLRTANDWRAILDAGRLAEVTGAFALAWSDADASLHLARDGIGERTLFYAPLSDGLVFASSLRAILATGLVARR